MQNIKEHFQQQKADPVLLNWIHQECLRQTEGLEMIASENYPSQAVLNVQGSILTNKYAEGYPKKRYYGGCEFVDQIEMLANERAQKLFSIAGSNVQPHSGSSANFAAFMALIQPGQKIMGMSLSHGGHLTHGSAFNFSGKFFESILYAVHPQTGLLDYDLIRDLAKKHCPKILIAGASAYPRIIDFSIMGEIARECNAYLVADIAHIAGLVATGLHPSPVGHAQVITSTTHKTLRGPRGGLILCEKDYLKQVNAAVFPGLQGGPLMHIIAAKAVAFGEALRPSFIEYQKNVILNAKVCAESLQELGFDLVTGGTDNHLLLLDCRKIPGLNPSEEVSGKDAEKWCEQAGITVNRNAIPDDPKGPLVTSGIRIGTAALTTRGFGKTQMQQIAHFLFKILTSRGDLQVLLRIREQVIALAEQFPMYRMQNHSLSNAAELR